MRITPDAVMRVDYYEKKVWPYGERLRRTIVFRADGTVSYPQGVPYANNWPDVMTQEFARRAFAAHGYRRVEGLLIRVTDVVYGDDDD